MEAMVFKSFVTQELDICIGLVSGDEKTRALFHTLATASELNLVSGSNPEELANALKDGDDQADVVLAVADADNDMGQVLDAVRRSDVDAPVVLGDFRAAADPEVAAAYDGVITPPGNNPVRDVSFTLQAIGTAVAALRQ